LFYLRIRANRETVESIYQNIESLAPYFYDFTVMPGSPLTLNQSKPEGNYKIPVKVTSTPNYYFNNMISYLFTVLNSINMSESEIENFKSVNKDIHKFYFKYNNSDYTFYLRSSESITLLTKSIRLLVESHNIFYLSDGKKINNQNFLKFTYFYFNNLNTANYNRYIIFDNNPQYNKINLVRSFQEISQMNKITVNSITNLKFQNNIITNKIKDINFYFDLVQFGNGQNYILRDLFKKIELINREKPGGINNWRSATFSREKIELNEITNDYLSRLKNLEKKLNEELGYIKKYKEANQYISDGFKKEIEVYSEMEMIIEAPKEADDWALKICEKLGNDITYINPIGGVDFFNREKYQNANINLFFQKMTLTEYNQKRFPFEQGLSIIDIMMFNSPEEINRMLDKFELI
jgi:hypothetical protein